MGRAKFLARVSSDVVPGALARVRNASKWVDGAETFMRKTVIPLTREGSKAAMDLQRRLIKAGTNGKEFEMGVNSCVTHVKRILTEAGHDVSRKPDLGALRFFESL